MSFESWEWPDGRLLLALIALPAVEASLWVAWESYLIWSQEAHTSGEYRTPLHLEFPPLLLNFHGTCIMAGTALAEVGLRILPPAVAASCYLLVAIYRILISYS